jgi:FMN phosphatase YigB (HAD superfamily)
VTDADPPLRAITLDFGNTLVPVDRAALQAVVQVTAEAAVERLGPFGLDAFLAAWADERDRQFREEVPQFREVDLGERAVRVLARLRGLAPPPPDERWDQALAAIRSTPAEIAWLIDAYSGAFIEAIPPPPRIRDILERLATGHDLAILSNWPLAATIDRYAAAAGWTPFLRAIVVSQRVGTIKPQPAIFDAAREQLGGPLPRSILHVGDDWQADVVGAAGVGWRVAYVRGRPRDSPLPSSDRDGSVVPDYEIDDIAELVGLLDA